MYCQFLFIRRWMYGIVEVKQYKSLPYNCTRICIASWLRLSAELNELPSNISTMITSFDNYYDMMKLSIYLIQSGDRGEYHSILFDPIMCDRTAWVSF